MIVNNIEEFIKYYLEQFNGTRVVELDFVDKKLYGTLLDYCFDNKEDNTLYQMIKDIYLNRFKGKKTDESYAYNYFVQECNPNQNKYSPKYKTKIGELYFYGAFLPKSYEKSFKWFLSDAERKSSNTMYFLGYMYYYGLYVKRDYDKAYEYLSMSFANNYYPSYYLMACCYFYGHGVEVDYEKAYSVLTQTINSNSYDKEEARYLLGLCYENGWGVEQNIHMAIDYYLTSAKGGYSKAVEKITELGFSLNTYLDIKEYNDGKYKVLNEINSDGKVVFLKNISHIGYDCKLIHEARMEGDYHHFKTTYIPAEYEFTPKKITISNNIKKIIISKEVKISEVAMTDLENIIIEMKN